jgi:hypothetical protein
MKSKMIASAISITFVFASSSSSQADLSESRLASSPDAAPSLRTRESEASFLAPGDAPSYSKLVQSFSQGQPPGDSELQGWHSGRCLREDRQEKILNSMLAFYYQPTSGQELSFMVLHNIYHGPDRYDDMSDAGYNEVDGFIRKNKISADIARREDGSLYSGGGRYGRFWLRKDGNDFVMKRLRDGLLSYCYYFKKIND